MSFLELPIVPPVQLESGTQVAGVWIGDGRHESSTALVVATSGDGRSFRARIDLQKEMFFDQMPSERDLEQAKIVSDAIKQAIEESYRMPATEWGNVRRVAQCH